MSGMWKQQYSFIHWSLVVVATVIFCAAIFLSFHQVSLHAELMFQLLFFTITVGLYLFEKQLVTSKGRDMMYVFLLTSSIAPVVSNITFLGDFVVMLGASLLLISLSFPIVISFMTVFVSNQPSTSDGKLTPLLLVTMSAIYNFCQFALLS